MAGTFPTLGKNPTIYNWDEQAAADPTIRSRSEGGYLKTRPRYTRIQRRWSVMYHALSNTDKGTLRAHEVDRKVGSESFTWTNPVDSQSYTVRFAAPVVYALSGHYEGSALAWDVKMILEEV